MQFKIGRKKDLKTNWTGPNDAKIEVTVPKDQIRIPQFATLEDAFQLAGGTEDEAKAKVVEYLNTSMESDAIGKGRLAGASVDKTGTIPDVIAKALKVMADYNPFVDRRSKGSAKDRAEKWDAISEKADTLSDAELAALVRAQLQKA
jgi:hypothetical protein